MYGTSPKTWSLIDKKNEEKYRNLVIFSKFRENRL